MLCVPGVSSLVSTLPDNSAISARPLYWHPTVLYLCKTFVSQSDSLVSRASLPYGRGGHGYALTKNPISSTCFMKPRYPTVYSSTVQNLDPSRGWGVPFEKSPFAGFPWDSHTDIRQSCDFR